MSAPRRLLAVILFAVLCLAALALTGLLNWISSLLFLALELLAECLRRLFARRPEPVRHARPRYRIAEPSGEPRPRPGRRKRGLRRRGNARLTEVAETPAHRVLVPLSHDQPGLIEFAVEECRERRAELIVLFLRPFAVMPMGSAPLPDQTEDAAACALFERVAAAAADASVPFRTLYRLTHDAPATILEAARAHGADIVVMQAGHRNRLARVVLGDEVQAVQDRLPGSINLLLHAACAGAP